MRKYELHETVFDSIDTPDKAYWLGFIMADGSVSGGTFRLGLSRKDREQVVKLQRFLGSTHPVVDYITSNGYEATRLDIGIKYFTESLNRNGIIVGKTNSPSIPNTVPAHLYSHFVRGLFDGDGGMYVSETQPSRHSRVHLYGEKEFMSNVNDIISTECGISPSRLHAINKSEKFKAVHWFGRRNIKAVHRWLYLDATTYMQRKYNNFLRFFELVESRRTLDIEEIRAIKDMLASGNYTQTEISTLFNTSQSNVSRINQL